MKEFKVIGRVAHNKKNDEWSFETKDASFSADILAGIDEIFDSYSEEIACENDELEIIIRIKNR